MFISGQKRIAEILSQIDNTIEKEEAYKQKLERIKKGLIEDLLTGKVRVNKLLEELTAVDFWENYTKQKNLKSYIISHLLTQIPSTRQTTIVGVAEEPNPYLTKRRETLFSKRNEIAQRLLELAYHIYGNESHGS